MGAATLIAFNGELSAAMPIASLLMATGPRRQAAFFGITKKNRLHFPMQGALNPFAADHNCHL